MASPRVGRPFAWLPFGKAWSLEQVEVFVRELGEVDRAYWLGLSPFGRSVYQRCLPWADGVRIAAERRLSAERDPVGFASCRVLAAGCVQAFWQWSAMVAGGSGPGMERARSEFLSAARGWKPPRVVSPARASEDARLFGSSLRGSRHVDG